MTQDNVVEIKNGKYRYRYDPTTGNMKYLGPVGDPTGELDEESFLGLMMSDHDEKTDIMVDVINEDLDYWRGQLTYIKRDVIKRDLAGVDPVDGTVAHGLLMDAVRTEMAHDMRKEYRREMKSDLTAISRKQWQMDLALTTMNDIDWVKLTEIVF